MVCPTLQFIGHRIVLFCTDIRTENLAGMFYQVIISPSAADDMDELAVRERSVFPEQLLSPGFLRVSVEDDQPSFSCPWESI
jgi:hypothetical protein